MFVGSLGTIAPAAEEIAWAAGLVEGEGCISHVSRGRYDDVEVAVNMTEARLRGVHLGGYEGRKT
jgi:hypothetical protein